MCGPFSGNITAVWLHIPVRLGTHEYVNMALTSLGNQCKSGMAVYVIHSHTVHVQCHRVLKLKFMFTQTTMQDSNDDRLCSGLSEITAAALFR
jgi:hypothetical protein